MLERLGMKDRPYRLVPTQPGENVAQTAVDVVNRGEGDMLMRGNTQTREFLLPLLVPENGLRTDKLLAHIDLVCMPEYPKVIAIGDVTVTIEPNLQQKKTIIADMVDMLKTVGYERPNKMCIRDRHMGEHIGQGGEAIGGQLQYKGGGLPGEQGLFKEQAGQDARRHADEIQPKDHQSGVGAEEGGG